MKTPGIYYGLIAALCVLTLCIGMVNAADVTQSATNCTARPGFGHGHPPSPNEMITHLEQQGADVTEVKAALQNGDTASVKAWLDNHRVAHKNQMPNGTSQPGPEKIIARLEQQGIDVTEVKTPLGNRDINAVKAWLDSNRDAHKDQMGPGYRSGNFTHGQDSVTVNAGPCRSTCFSFSHNHRSIRGSAV